MTKKTWVGGGNNNASNAKDWSPKGVPVPGDTIDIQSGTMNIRGNDLAGNTLLLDKPFTNTAATTLNLTRHASVSLNVPAFLSETVTVNVQGTDTLHVANATPSDLFLTVNLADHATLTGNFNLLFGRTVVHGGSGSSLVNNGTSALHGNGIILDTNVNGVGNFTVSSAQGSIGRLEFGGSVSHGQTVDVGADPGRGFVSQVQVDHPGAFKGSVSLETNGELDLMGLTDADSYQLKNDILSIYSGAAVIDRVRLTLPAPPSGPVLGITVRQTSAGVVVDRGPSSQAGTLLPVHQQHGSITV